MMAMTDDCCLYFCGDGHGLEDFYRMMTTLVEREDSQYSFKNTLAAMAISLRALPLSALSFPSKFI